MDEWNYEKNADSSPEDISSGSGKKFWRHCKTYGYDWCASIDYRTNGRGCPYCSHKVFIPRRNDLATLRPELMKEWDFQKATMDSTQISIHSGKKAWWNCSVCGNEWSSVIVTRSDGTGCTNWRERKKRKQSITLD